MNTPQRESSPRSAATTTTKKLQQRRQSPLYRDLAASPIKENGFSNPAQQAAASALFRRENMGSRDLPPPPIISLEDRQDTVSPHPPLLLHASRDYTPVKPRLNFNTSLFSSNTHNEKSGFASPSGKTPGPASTPNLQPNVPVLGFSDGGGVPAAAMDVQGRVSPGNPSSSSSPAASSSMVLHHDKDQPGRLITVPPPREFVRPDFQGNGVSDRVSDDEEWVTVFGFTPSETNTVLREFEKCGFIIKHVPGPGEANWMHILYQNRFSAQKALQKNGSMINGITIIGVKPLEPHHRQLLMERSNHGLMPVVFQPTNRELTLGPSKAVTRPYYLQSNEVKQRPAGAMASPSKSAISKLVDLMFGI